MISVQPFTLDVIKTHKCFYLLHSISDVSEVQIAHNTPAGHTNTDVADAFAMQNGQIVIAWKSPLNIAPMHNLVVISGDKVENVNLTPLERIIDIYDRPVDAQVGTFIFTNSDMVLAPNLDWRCDNGKFGPKPFQDVKIIDQLSEIIMYEPILSVNGIGHLIYIEGVGKQTVAEHHLNSDTHPVAGRTLWESLKLISEWSIVYGEPFNNTESVAYKASAFLNELRFTDDELSVINEQVPMQIANYLMGDTNARQRPAGISPINDSIKNMIFSRMASCSITALEYMNPGLWDLQELLEAEREQLEIDKVAFEHMKLNLDPARPVIAIQERVFANKQSILDGGLGLG